MSRPVPRFKQLNLTQLRVFCEFLRQRSFTEAARALGVSHSAVWQQIRALERRFGVILLVRRGRAWLPTTDGEALLDLASGVLHSLDHLEDEFRRLSRDLPRTLHIIGSPGAVSGELVLPLVEFRKLQPNCRIHLAVGPDIGHTIERLLTGEADLAIVPESYLDQTRLPRALVREVIAERPAVIAMQHNHPLANKRRLTLRDLIDQPLILPIREHGWRQRVDEVFEKAGLLDKLHVVIETSLIQALQRYVAAGMGIAIYPQNYDEPRSHGISYRPADRWFPGEKIALVRHAKVHRAEAQLFEKILRKGTV